VRARVGPLRSRQRDVAGRPCEPTDELFLKHSDPPQNEQTRPTFHRGRADPWPLPERADEQVPASAGASCVGPRSATERRHVSAALHGRGLDAAVPLGLRRLNCCARWHGSAARGRGSRAGRHRLPPNMGISLLDTKIGAARRRSRRQSAEMARGKERHFAVALGGGECGVWPRYSGARDHGQRYLVVRDAAKLASHDPTRA